MRLARLVLAASSLPFVAIGCAFLVAPAAAAERVGLTLHGALADNDVRAVYGGLQLACGVLLWLASRAGDALVRAGLAAQVVLYGGLASARVLSLALVGAPGALGFALHAGEFAALVLGAIAWRSLRREPVALRAEQGATIERAAADDLAELLPLVDAFQREQGFAAGDGALRVTVRDLLGDPQRGAVLVARASDRAMLGYAALCFGYSIEFRGRDAFVDELYVVPVARGRGLGRALLHALEAEARACGVVQLHLEVEHRNEQARRLYVAEQFAATGRELLTKRLA
jgi:ribosomal protein S18 acetylase RimI-like enzyme